MDIRADLGYNHIGYDAISYFRWHLPNFEKRRIWMEFIQNRLSEEHEILQTYQGQLAPQTCQT